MDVVYCIVLVCAAALVVRVAAGGVVRDCLKEWMRMMSREFKFSVDG